MRKPKTASKSQSSSPDEPSSDNARTKFFSAATDVWSNVNRDKAKYRAQGKRTSVIETLDLKRSNVKKQVYDPTPESVSPTKPVMLDTPH
jgi:hypothetical protein